MGVRERLNDLTAEEQNLEGLFPELKADGYEITSQRNSRYNCIAWAAGDQTRWWQPVPSPVRGQLLGGYYWPEGIEHSFTLRSYVHAFRRQGFRVCDEADLEDGWEKVAIYVDSAGVPSHAARQTKDGIWASKCGILEDIEHSSLVALEGGGNAYGTVSTILKRRRRDLPSPQARNIL